jgi:hypothetical protein
MRPGELLRTSFLIALLCGCTTAAPRFEPDVATALRRDTMRRLETERLVIYYPEGRLDTATRTAERVEGCIEALRARAQIKNGFSNQKMVMVMPELPLNNDFAAPPGGGQDPFSIVPTYATADFTSSDGSPSDPSADGCHEFTHYVHALQIGGLWRVVNAVFGNVLTPQKGLDTWFWEGLATYYESALQPGVGRLGSLWDGYFHAGVAGRRLDGGDLSALKRDFDGGRHYLVGSRFIEFLVDRYGEERLWRLIRLQGRSILFPFGVNARFWQAYDRSLSTLIDEFADEVAARYPVRQRPADQRPVHRLGTTALYAVARNGTEAIVSSGLEEPVRLTVHAPDGRLLRRLALQDIVLPRRILVPDARFVSGLSLTDDGKQVFLAVLDQGPTFSAIKLIRYEVETDRLEVAHPDLGGAGGGIDGSGRHYFFTRARGDRHDLAELEVSSGRVRIIAGAEPRGYFNAPRPSPDGRRLVAIHWDMTRDRASLLVLDRASGQRLAAITDLGQTVLDPSWVDDQHLVFAAATEGRPQIFVHDLGSATTTLVTRAPYLARSPRPTGDGRLRFLNREGWGWTVDELPLPRPVARRPVARPGLVLASYHEPTAGRAPPPVSAAPVVLSDGPYSAWEHLLVPQLRSFSVTSISDPVHGQRWLIDAALAGADHLSYHSWALWGGLDLGTRKGNFGASYANSQLAPFTITAAAAQRAWTEDVAVGGAGTAAMATDRFNRSASLGIARTFYTHSAELFLQAQDDRLGERRRKMGGPGAVLALSAVEATPYSGARRGFQLETSGQLFPAALTSSSNGFANLGGSITAVAPVPGLRRPTFILGLRGRGIFGLEPGSGLLQVGGLGSSLFHSSNRPDGPRARQPTTLPDLGDSFFEPLRGYEDYAITVDRVTLADAVFRYPIIVDRGSASTLGLLPSFFVQQLDLQAFGSGAWDTLKASRDHTHAAVGAAIRLRLTWLRSLSVAYQFAHRLLDDQASVHLVSVSAD